MKHLRLLLVAALCWAASSVVAAPTLYIDDANGVLGTVDVATGAATVIGPLGVLLTDIAFAPDGTLYGMSATDLYVIDPTTAQVTIVGPHGIPGGNALVFDANGTLYAAGNTSTFLYSVDVNSGFAAAIADTGYNSAGDLAFNGGELYLSSTTDQLIQIDPETFSAHVVGDIGFQSVFGLATGDDGVLYGVTGTNVISVDPSTGTGTLLVDYGGQGLAAAYGTSFITEALPVITSPLTDSAVAELNYSYQITATNAPFFYDATGLPDGLSIANDTGIISGAPQQPGNFSITLYAFNPGGGVGTATLSLTVVPEGAPVISSATAAAGQAGVFFHYQIAADNMPTSFTASGLPAGLTFYPGLGVISGAPMQAGTSVINFSVTNFGGTTAGSLTLTVAAAPPPLPVVTVSADVARVTAGTGEVGEFVLTRTGADASAVLRIHYAVKGSAVRGTDYFPLKGIKRMKPGVTSVKIRVHPLGEGAGPGVTRVVRLELATADGYTVGLAHKAKVRITGQ